MNNDTEEFINVENEATSSSKEFESDDVNVVGDKQVPSDGFLDTPSDATTTEATSGSSIEDVPSSKQRENYLLHACYLEPKAILFTKWLIVLAVLKLKLSMKKPSAHGSNLH